MGPVRQQLLVLPLNQPPTTEPPDHDGGPTGAAVVRVSGYGAPMSELRFDGQVVVVTGAGRNLGRAYALLLAERGAKVVVNDLGVGISDTDGVADAPSENPAHAVVEEIRAAGGAAVANLDSIATPSGGEAIVAAAIEHFGGIHALINNAGVVRQAPVEDYTDQFCRDMLDTHVLGAMNVTRPAWRAMKAQGYGRIVNVSSGSAFGIAGMSVYSAVKMAVVGLTRSQALEGEAHGIKVNVLAPYASVRGNDFGPIAWSPELAEYLSPAQVAPLATLLAHQACPASGEWFTVGGGTVSRVGISVHDGHHHRPATPENVLDHWDAVLGTEEGMRLETLGGSGAMRSMFQSFDPT